MLRARLYETIGVGWPAGIEAAGIHDTRCAPSARALTRGRARAPMRSARLSDMQREAAATLLDEIRDPEERRAAQQAEQMYQRFAAEKARGKDDETALADAGWATATAASAAIGPWGPVVIIVARALFEALKMSGAAPEALVQAPPVGTAVFYTLKLEGYNQSGLWGGPMLLFYRELAPDWLARELAKLGQDPASYWAHVRAHVPVVQWKDVVHDLYFQTLIPGTVNQFGWGQTDEPRVTAEIVRLYPYRPVTVGERFGGAKMLQKPVEPKAIRGLLGRLGPTPTPTPPPRPNGGNGFGGAAPPPRTTVAPLPPPPAPAKTGGGGAVPPPPAPAKTGGGGAVIIGLGILAGLAAAAFGGK